MNATIIASTKEASFDKKEAAILAGKNAGICYMGDNYFSSNVTDPKKALERFSRVSKIGHHSIADHVQVEVLFERIPKAVAMVLNNLGCYATSEKSGRYTIMTGNTKLENDLYQKWCSLFETCIANAYPDSQYKKLAQENARYLLDVFSESTTMGYTTSIRQWTYIIDWMNEYIERYDCIPYAEFEYLYEFELKLSKSFKEIVKLLVAQGLYINELSDTKDRTLNVFNNNDIYDNWDGSDYNLKTLDDLFVAKFKGTFVQFAQLQRHRTLNLIFSVSDEKEVYVPPIIRNTQLEKEWLTDMQSIKDAGIIPQGTMIACKLWGTIPDFLLMCKERICGRAQIEVMQTALKLFSMLYNENATSKAQKELNKWCNVSYNDVKVFFSKCKCISCKEPCLFIKDGLENRIV